MRKKRSIQFRINDLVIVSVCLICLCGSLFLFRRDINKVLVDLNRAPIAAISFKTDTVMRRLQNRMLWDRLKVNSLIYNGDIIRLSENSQATILFFADGSSLDMFANSMARIFVSPKGISVELDDDGAIAVTATDTSAGFSITDTSGARIEIEGKSQLSVERTSGVMGVQVTEGRASLVSPSGEKHEVDGGTALQVSSGGTIEVPPLAVISPPASLKVAVTDGKSVPVPFEWITDSRYSEIPVTLTTSTNVTGVPVLSRQEVTSGTSAVVQASAGTTYWTLSAADIDGEGEILSVTGQITGISLSSPQLIAPAEKQSFLYRDKNPRIRFQWQGDTNASSYLLEVADNPELRSPHISEQLAGTSAVIADLDAGIWYWRVTPFYAFHTAAAIPSEVSSFSIELKESLSVPIPLGPAENAMIVRSSKTENRDDLSVYFSWSGDRESVMHTVSFASDADFKNVVHTFTVPVNYLSVNFDEITIPDGVYYWRIISSAADGSTSSASAVRSFAVITESEAAENETAEPTVINAADDMALSAPTGPVPVLVLEPKNKSVFDGLDALRNGICIRWSCSEQLRSSRFVLSRKEGAGDYIPVLTREDPAKEISVVRLIPGEYQWFLEGITDSGKDIVMEPSSFTVQTVPLLAPAVLLEPVSGFTIDAAYLRKNRTVQFRWEPAEGATHQIFSIYRRMADGKPGWKVLQTELSGTDSSYTVQNLTQFDVGSFIWTIEAEIRTSDGFTEQFGTAASSVFSIEIPLPEQVEVNAPLIAEDE